MDAIYLIEQIQQKNSGKLLLTGLAFFQYPTVQTKQLTFFNPHGGKQDYYIGTHHIFIRRTRKNELNNLDHILFIARHIELYANEIDAIIDLLDDIPLKELKKNDKAWRLFAYLKKHCLNEKVTLKKSIGRRYIDLGNIYSEDTIKDNELFVRDALFIPRLAKKEKWQPLVRFKPYTKIYKNIYEQNRKYFKKNALRPLFNKFCRYASKLESAASAKIEGYDANVDVDTLGLNIRKRLRRDLALRANINMDNIHRDLPRLVKEPLSLDLLMNVQKAIVYNTWNDESEMIDKTPGKLRHFDEVIVNRGLAGHDNVVYLAPKAQDISVLLDELIAFYHVSRAEMSPLDMAAIFKCQLVVIHPFGDGNGRLARWFFFYILMKEGFIENIHQAPISQIFLHEKNRYYEEILKVDSEVMDKASYQVDNKTRRYHVQYDDLNMFRKFDYSSWLSYVYDAFARALEFSIEEHKIFEKTQSIFKTFIKKTKVDLNAGQQHEVLRAINIGFRKQWGKKTEKRMSNNGIPEKAIRALYELINKSRDKFQKPNPKLKGS